MFQLSARSGFAIAFAVLCLGVAPTRAQTMPLPYWASDWSSGFNGNLPGLAGGNVRSGDFVSRYNFPNGSFVGSEYGGMGRGLNFGSFGTPAFSYQGVQLGYNFTNSPVTVYAGFDNLKFNPGLIGALTPFDSPSNVDSGYRAHIGVELRPTSNLSLSVGASVVQPPTVNNLLAQPDFSSAGFARR